MAEAARLGWVVVYAPDVEDALFGTLVEIASPLN